MSNAPEKIVIVTGGARGVGRRIAHRLARTGGRVYICDVNESAAASAAHDLRTEGLDVRSYKVDLSAEDAPQGMVRHVMGVEGRLDVLVNNAQSKLRRSFLDETTDSWQAGLAVTLNAAFFASQEAARSMRGTGGGVVVNIASVAAFLATHESPAYHVAKAGLVQLTRYLAVACGPLGVRVNCICPGFIVQEEHRGRFLAEDNARYRGLATYCQPTGAVGDSDDVAECAAFLCSDQSRFVNGQAIILDGGATIQEQFSLLHAHAAQKPR